MIDLGTAEQISRGFVGITQGKHKLVWRGAPGHMGKDKVKLLLNLIACSVTALPKGGEIDVAFGGSLRNAELPPALQGQRRTSAAVSDGLRGRQSRPRSMP